MIAEKGSKVKVDYEGRLEDGTVFDSSKHGDHSHPLEFIVGNGEVVQGFDRAVKGMKLGEEKEFKLKPEEAYGERKEELKQKIPLDAIKADRKLEPGMLLIMGAPDGNKFPVKILEVEEKTATIDLNHPLAGKTLIFKVKIVSMEKGG